MKQRIQMIYIELYNGLKTKNELADKLDVNAKTIENTIGQYSEDIIMDKNLGAYRFNSLLPSKIPISVLFKLFGENIENQIIKNDFLSSTKLFYSNENISLPMIDTKNLSSLTKKVIMCDLAVNFNCTIKINYFGNKGVSSEIKFIKPHKVFVDTYKYYIYGSYAKKNEKNIGEFRTFAINGISSIMEDEYIKNEIFYIDSNMNAYGLLNKDKYVYLTLKSIAANFFKKEGLFNKDNFDFIDEEIDGSINARMYYNNIQEIVNILQKWMPYINVRGEMSERVYEYIKMNYEEFMNSIVETTSI